MIALCLMLLPWAHFRLQESAIKLHTLLDLRGSIPTVVTLTKATVNERLLSDTLPIEPGAIYVLARSCTYFARLARFTAGGAFFVIRRVASNPENAVQIQLWCAVSTYVLVAILKKTLKLEPSLHHIVQVISLTPFEKVPLPDLFAPYPSTPT